MKDEPAGALMIVIRESARRTDRERESEKEGERGSQQIVEHSAKQLQ